MNQISPFVRKIIYIAVIAALLLAISFIARPEISKDGQVVNPGGRLSQMRREFKLAQASISEIDPTSEAMKLASMGLRGVAVNVLWMQALEHQKNEDYDKLAQTLQTLTKVQPNFVKVWEFQGHNLAFNVSMEFDDYEYRYDWVKKGLSFLKGGIAYNVDDHRMMDNMGFFTGTKFGKSDEKLPFRRIFRKDKDFHNDMSDYIAPDSYDARVYGPDSYKMAWHWFDEAENLVDNGARPYKSDLMFRMQRPSQRRQQAMILADEFRSDEVHREIWEDAGDQWTKYGNIDLRNAQDVSFTLERTDEYEARITEIRNKLDKLTPGVRKKQEMAVWKSLGMEEDMFIINSTPVEELNDGERNQVYTLLNTINDPDKEFDKMIAQRAPDEDRMEAVRLADEIRKVINQRQAISKDGGVVNYSFWKSRSEAESTDAMIRARQAMYDAIEMKRKSIFEDEYVFDYETGEKTITRRGAAKLFEEAFSKWNDVLKEHEDLISTPVMDELVQAMVQYRQLIAYSGGKGWPDDFVLQWVVDERARLGEPDNLPTSDQIKARNEDAAYAAEVEAEEAEDEDEASMKKEEAGSAAKAEEAESEKAEAEETEADSEESEDSDTKEKADEDSESDDDS